MAAIRCRAVSSVSVLGMLLAAPALAQTVQELDRASTADAKTANGTAEASRTDQSRDDGLADIIVTAQKTASTLQRTPLSVSVINGPELSNQARTAADDVLKNIPGVEVQGAARGLVIAIRGLGSDLPPGVGESSVSTNFDGAYNIRAEANVLGFYDLDRVEVLRGPQSTLYGRNATGGVVNVISAVPKIGEDEAAASIGAGDYGLIRGEGMANLALGDQAALRAAFTSIRRHGYLNNGHDDQVGTGVRAKALWKPSPDLTALLGFEGSWIKGHGPGAVEVANFEAGRHYTTADSGIGGQDFFGYKIWSQVDWRIGPGTLTVLPAYQHGHGTNNNIFGGRGTYGDDPKIVRQESAEVRYASDPGSPVTWLVGYYHYNYLQYTTSFANATFGSSDGFTRNRGDSDAVFGQATVPLATGFRLIGGGRYTWDKRHALGSGFLPGTTVGGDVDGRFFDYRAGLEYDLSDRSLLYFTTASAFRPGGVNPFLGGTFKPERLHSYEVGSKNRFLDNHLQVNASAFYYDYANFQVVDFFIAPTGPSLVFYNVDATNYGGELEALARPGRNDTINLSVAYLHSRIDGDLILHPADPFTAVNFRGERLPHSPAWTVKAGYQHILEIGGAGTLTPHVDLRYTTRQFIAPNNAGFATQKAYFAGDLTLGWASANGRFGLTGYVKNVTNKAVKTGYFVGYLTVAPPRTYGFTATARF